VRDSFGSSVFTTALLDYFLARAFLTGKKGEEEEEKRKRKKGRGKRGRWRVPEQVGQKKKKKSGGRGRPAARTVSSCLPGERKKSTSGSRKEGREREEGPPINCARWLSLLNLG